MPDDGYTEAFDGLTPLPSEMADDADMTAVIDYFLDALDARIGSITDAWSARSRVDLRLLACELKGVGGGYGYPDITETAADLERLLLADEIQVSAVGERVEALILLCRRACLRPGTGTY